MQTERPSSAAPAMQSGAAPRATNGDQARHQSQPIATSPRLRSSGAPWALRVPGWGPAAPTALRTWRLRSSRAHSDRKPAVEVQRCPLRSEPGGWGPAVPTQIGSLQLRSSSAHCARKLAKRLAKSWQGGSGRGSWCRHGRGEAGGGGRGRGGGGGGEKEEDEENSSDKI